MKKRVEFSTFSTIITCLALLICAGVGLWKLNATGNEMWAWGFLIIAIVFGAFVLFYAPLYIRVDNDNLIIERSLKQKIIPISEISSVKLCPPTMGAIRLCGSGGAFGYWGWFSEKDLGKYFAYYGKSSDCFLITLKNGMKYMLGCKDAPDMVDYIKHRII